MPQPDRFRGTFNADQTRQLLAPIKPQRVLRDGKGNSHVSHQDVVAHLTRIFGYGNWGTEILYCEPVFESARPHGDDVTPNRVKYDVAYRAMIRLTIFDEYHNPVTFFEDGSIGDSQNLTRADAHDLAMKSALSLALKRCAKNLGDQFGLSLYNKGQMEALVRGTLVLPARPEGAEATPDVQEGVPEQVSLGVDEIEKTSEASDEQEQRITESLGATKIAEEPNTDHTED